MTSHVLGSNSLVVGVSTCGVNDNICASLRRDDDNMNAKYGEKPIDVL
jgi:hypothetical protein